MAFDPSAEAQALRKAMKGFGTDDKALIEHITKLSNEQLQEVRAAFQKDLQRDLIDDIKGETSGDYERALVGLVLTRAEFDARQLNKAVKGMGTDEDVFVQTLTHRTTQEIDSIEAAYLNLFGKTLAHDIEGDFSGDGKLVALGLIKHDRQNPKVADATAVNEMVQRLHAAGAGKWGTDEATFLEVMCTSGQEYLRTLNEAYGRAHGVTLVAAVKSEFSGFASKALAAMIKDHDEFYADLIWEACDGAGTDEDLLTRVIVARRHLLKDINNKFMAKYDKSIAHRVEAEVSNNYGKVLKAVALAA